MIERIKGFLEQNKLNWTGEIITMFDNDFRPAEDKDFKEKDIFNLLLSFEEGNACLAVEIDLVSFYVLGEFHDLCFEKYAGNKEQNKELMQQRDLSKEWVEFQLKNSPLVYSTALKKYCEKRKAEIEKSYEKSEKLLKAKLNNLQMNKEQRLKEYDDLEALIENADKTL